MKTTMKHFFVRGALITAMLFMAMLMGESASAIVKTDITLYPDKAGEKASAMVDVDCDGVQNTVSVSYSLESENRYTDKVFVEVDGRLALELDVRKYNGYGVTAELMTYNQQYFLMQLWAHTDSDYMGYNYLYGYDKGAGSFYQLVDFNEGIHRYGGLVTDFYEDEIMVSCSDQPPETGWIYWTSFYKWKDGKLVKDTGRGWVEHKIMDPFTVNKRLTFYKKAGSKKKAFILKKGDKVSLQNIKVTKNKIFAQFRYKKKTGWIRLEYTGDCFKDVHKYLAG